MSRNGLGVEHLTIAPGGQVLIEDLNWRVLPGEFWCILGPNGVGKSCLLHTLSGHEPPASGQILLDGVPLAYWPAQEIAVKRGLMPQQQVDDISMTAFAAVLAGRAPHLADSGQRSEEDTASARAALATVGLTHKADMGVLTLSAGERQRVALAALLAQDPMLMLLDEPVAHQHPSQQRDIMCLIRDLADSHIVVASCHDIDLAAQFATHVLLLAEGHHWLGPANDVLNVEILQQAFDCRFELRESGGFRNFVPC